jgi:hypothetical protein
MGEFFLNYLFCFRRLAEAGARRRREQEREMQGPLTYPQFKSGMEPAFSYFFFLIFFIFNRISHAAWLDNHALTLKSNTAK